MENRENSPPVRIEAELDVPVSSDNDRMLLFSLSLRMFERLRGPRNSISYAWISFLACLRMKFGNLDLDLDNCLLSEMPETT